MNDIAAFWHCFGTHGGESPGDIQIRKKAEIANTGWTLWSFRASTDSSVQEWLHLIGEIEPSKVLVFCSSSRCATDPKGECAHAREYRELPSPVWRPIPPTIDVPHPFGRRTTASAFRVIAVETATPIPALGNKYDWYCLKDRSWRSDRIPTRGEYLLRPHGQATLRPVSVILTLAAPYVVQLRR